MQKFVNKRTRTGTILVVADVLRPLAPPVVYTGTGCNASKDVFGCKEKFWNVCNFEWFSPTGGANGLDTSATTKIVPVFVLLWTNFCNQVM